MPAIILPLFEAPLSFLPLWLLAFWETRLPGPAGRKLFGKDAISGLSEVRALPAFAAASQPLPRSCDRACRRRPAAAFPFPSVLPLSVGLRATFWAMAGRRRKYRGARSFSIAIKASVRRGCAQC